MRNTKIAAALCAVLAAAVIALGLALRECRLALEATKVTGNWVVEKIEAQASPDAILTVTFKDCATGKTRTYTVYTTEQ